MESEIFSKQMAVLELLLADRDYSVAEICDRAVVSRRTFFRYLENYRAAGFEVVSHNNCFSVSIDSPFVSKLMSSMLFSEEEIGFICSAIKACGPDDQSALSLKRKFRRVYGINFDLVEKETSVASNKIAKLEEAINRRKVVVLGKYSSPHSQTETDRIVEPFYLLPARGEVRCYEPSSGICKTFKLSRIQRVRILEDQNWEHREQHHRYYTDIFGFSGETETRIKLRVGYLARQILMEEYGVPERLFYKDDDRHWTYYCNVCNFGGIGRFVMGLSNDIEVLDCEDFLAYLRQTLVEATKKFAEKDEKNQ